MNIKKQILLCLLILFIGFTGCKKSTDDEGKSGRWRFKYNDNRQLAKVIRPDNQTVKYRYNERGKLSSVKSKEHEEQFEYNRLGLLTRTIDNTGSTRLERDAFGRLEKMVYPRGNEVNYHYNEDGDITKVAWGNSHFLAFSRDLMGRTVRMDSPAGTFRIQHDYSKRLMQRIYPNGAFSQFTFNREGRPVLIQHVLPNRQVIYEFRYTYDNAGLLEVVHELSPNGKMTIQYTYDEYDQLVKAEYSDGRIYSYEYDAFGNRANYSAPMGNVTATYDTRDRIQTLQGKPVKHDPVGNVTTLGNSTFTYNVKDSLIDDGVKKYKYNALGLRVEASGKDGTSEFVHFIDDLPYVLAEKGKTGKKYLWNEGQCLGQIEDDNRVLYFFEDHLGSIRCALDQAGNIVGHAEYSPFGVPIQRIPGVRFGFAGEEQDEEGKVYLRARYYEPKIGRFLTKDPVGVQLMDSIKQNRYAYAANSPLNFKDIEGAYPVWNWDTWRRDTGNFWNGIVTGRYFGTGFGEYAAQYWANRYVDTNKLRYAVMGTVASLWQPDTYWKTGLTLGGGWAASALVSGTLPSVSSKLILTGTLLGSRGEPFYLPILGKFVHYGIGRFGPHIGIGTGGKALLHFYQTHINIGGARGIDIASHIIPGIVDGVRTTFQNIWDIKDRKKDTKDDILNLSRRGYDDDSRIRRLFPPFPPDDGGGGGGGILQIPNVGGVYLNKAAEIIGELSGIEGVTFDPVSSRLILIGDDNEQKFLPSIRIDDLAAAFRTVFGDYDHEPGVTIDPNPQNPMADQMIVRFFGGMENTHFGHVLFEADRFMKSLSLGKDNISRQPVKANVKDYHNILQLAFSNLGGTYNKNLWSRFWLVPDKVIVQVSDDGKSITFPDTRIKINTETMRWRHGELVPAGGVKDEKAEYFAAHFTRYYDEYANEFPIYQELKNLANLVGLAKWLKESGKNVDLTWLKKFDKPLKTPGKTPSLTVRDRQRSGRGIRKVSIFGGVNLEVNNRYVKDDGTLSGYAKKALETIGSLPGAAGAAFLDDNNRKKRVVALPTSQTRAGGAKIIRGHELELIPRTFCSFHNDAGQFGHSWVLEFSELHFIQPNKKKKEYIKIGNKKVLVREFLLITPFRFLDVRFKEHTVDQQYRSIAFLPQKNEGIRALYPNDERGEYRVEYTDGSFDLFNSQGKIVRSQETPSDYLEYIYDGSGRLVNVIQTRQNKRAKHLKLFYDDQVRISSAETSTGNINYTYAANNDLVKVDTRKDTFEYTYDNRHLVTEVKINTMLTAQYQYDDFGRVLALKEKEENLRNREIKTIDENVEITERIGEQTSKRIYDAGGRLLEAMNPSGDKVNIDYCEMGSPKVMQYTNRFGDITKVEYSSDKKQVKYTNPEGDMLAFLFDEFGRLKQIQDEKSALLTRNYGMTNRGWMEETITPGKTVQAFFNKQKQPTEYLLTSKVPGGGQIQVKNDYNIDGTLRQKQIKGLLNETHLYEKKKLKQIISGDEVTNLTYDSQDLLKEMNSPDAQTSYEYDREGNVTSIQVKRREGQETYSYTNGQISGRQSISKRNDTFQYDQNGQLAGVKKGKDENWQIKREGKRMTTLRNNQIHMEAVFNDEGMLTELVD